VDLVRQDGQLVINALSNREPMQLLEEWLRWRWSGTLQNYTSRSVLHALQLLNTAGWSSVQHSVAVVQPRQYRAARQSKCQFQRYPQELVKLRHRQCHPRVRTGKSSLCHVFQYDQFEYRSVGSLRYSRASTIDSIFFTLDVGITYWSWDWLLHLEYPWVPARHQKSLFSRHFRNNGYTLTRTIIAMLHLMSLLVPNS